MLSSDSIRLTFDYFLRMREANIKFIESVSSETLTVIPTGFRNNIFWHAGHLVTVQASLLYRRANQPVTVPQSYFDYFGKGTSPNDFDQQTPHSNEVLANLKQSTEITPAELDRLCQLQYHEPVTLSSGQILTSVGEALLFLPIHESYHLGSMNAMSKFL